ncbi:unnamed protein product [Schistosoma margrebowiei]|uniref:Titin n=2 Tax=Schistosoma margrebowiei TaxID=48269 RepID=A0A183MH06_9TREM|nr:unnamed protein product [Schistosoma margrebowiei]VDP18024.1 unnamed protein product [Schistosoma margrebowiei]
MSTVAMPATAYQASTPGNPPQILGPLSGGGEVPEGEPVHLELRIAPPGDLQVQWFKDGVALSAGSRYNTMCERGLASLDVIYTIPEDSGTYFCVISNPYGHAQSEAVPVNVIPEIDPSQDHIDLQSADLYQATSAPTKEYERDQRSQPKSAPHFTQQPVISSSDVLEGEPVRIEAYLDTTSDSTLQVDWMKNGQPVGTGSRFNAVLDRGLIVLEIGYCLAEDSGLYVCVATNALGHTESQPVELRCQPEERIVTKSILDQQSINHLKQLEEPGEDYDYMINSTVQGIPPSFKANLEPSSVQVSEDEPVIFSVPVDCGNGDRLVIEWKRDGQVVKTGSRITGRLELGIASLKIHYAQPNDTGAYTCHVSTEYGSADCGPSNLLCEATGSIIAASQLPGDKEKGLLAIEAIEANLHAPRGTVWEDDSPHEAPVIIQQPQLVGEIEEGTAIHFDVQVEPAADPSLIVEWFKSGNLLTSGTRFKVAYERGLAILDLLYTIPEDSGEYWCRVENKAGQVESNHVQVLCNPSASVITHSNLLQGSEGYNLIKAIEEVDQPDGDEYRYVEDEEVDSAPNFDVKPQPATIGEGSPVKFLVRVSGKPTPQLTWYLNDEPIEQDSITKIYSDGAINYLEMNRCPALQGTNKLHVIAQNQLGKAEAETILTVLLAEDFRPDLKHVKPENPYKKMVGLRKVDCSPELNKALTRTKPSAQTIMEMERGSEMKARMYRSPEVIEAEKMLDQLALNLKKSEVKRPLVNGGHQNDVA